MSQDPTVLPRDLPAPEDDGACDHLLDQPLPSLALPSSQGGTVDLAGLAGRSVVFCFPRAAQPGVPMPADWDQTPGARGCTPQAAAFRDHYDDIRALHAGLFGLSTQTAVQQGEIATRLQLPFPLLSDSALAFATALRLPVFEQAGQRMIKRLTLIIADGRIEKVFYPVFPPDLNAEEVVVWLLAHPRRPLET